MEINDELKAAITFWAYKDSVKQQNNFTTFICLSLQQFKRFYFCLFVIRFFLLPGKLVVWKRGRKAILSSNRFGDLCGTITHCAYLPTIKLSNWLWNTILLSILLNGQCNTFNIPTNIDCCDRRIKLFEHKICFYIVMIRLASLLMATH